MGVIVSRNIVNAGGDGIRVETDDNHVADNIVEAEFGGEHGVHLVGCQRVTVQNNRIGPAGGDTDNTYDLIFLGADVDDCLITGNRLRPRTTGNQTRYGVNVSAATCECNRIAGNDLGDPADYGTDALNDSGTDTWLTFPGDATYGDNWTVCTPTS